jgi:hypothetical protein
MFVDLVRARLDPTPFITPTFTSARCVRLGVLSSSTASFVTGSACAASREKGMRKGDERTDRSKSDILDPRHFTQHVGWA